MWLLDKTERIFRKHIKPIGPLQPSVGSFMALTHLLEMITKFPLNHISHIQKGQDTLVSIDFVKQNGHN